LRLRWFSYGVKFKSNNKGSFLAVLDFDTSWLWIGMTSCEETLCFLMCPPKACPIWNTSPQMEHWCNFGVPTEHEKFEDKRCNFLWLARWPPRAWKERNCLLQVLHLNSPFFRTLFLDGLSSTNIKQLVMVVYENNKIIVKWENMLDFEGIAHIYI